MIAIAAIAQGLDALTFSAFVGPAREGNVLMAALSLEAVLVVKGWAIASVLTVAHARRLRLVAAVVAVVGIVGAASNVGAAL